MSNVGSISNLSVEDVYMLYSDAVGYDCVKITDATTDIRRYLNGVVK